MVLEGPALLQDYRNQAEAKHSSAWRMEVDETLRRPSEGKRREVWRGWGGAGMGHGNQWGRCQMKQEEVLVTAPVSTGPPGGSVVETRRPGLDP